MKLTRVILSLAAICCLIFTATPQAAADSLCVKNSRTLRGKVRSNKVKIRQKLSKDITLVSGDCPSGTTKVADITASTAPTVQVTSESFEINLPVLDDIQGNSHACPDGTLAIAGGASIVSNDGLMLKTSIPQTDLGGWSATVQVWRAPATGTLNIYAVCATGFTVAP